MFLLSLAAERPNLYLDEYCSWLEMESGKKISISRMCKVLSALDLPRKVMYKRAAQASAFLEGAFLNLVVAHVPSDRIAWLDEFGT